MDPYDKSKVGRLISHGWDSLVYEYDSDKVIKFSHLGFLLGKKGIGKKEQDYTICKKYFGDYVLYTEIITPRGSKRTIQLQPRVTGHYLTKKDLKDESILVQFREIVKADEAMSRDGHGWLDLIGHKGAYREVFSNVFVTPQNKLVIFDVMVMNFSNLGLFYPLFLVVWGFNKWRQVYLINYFLKP